MRFVPVTLLFTSFLTASLLSGPIQPSESQPVPIRPPQGNTFVRNVGQVDPTKPVRITFVNRTGFLLYAAISGGIRVELPPQARTTFDFNSVPINVFAYSGGPSATLRYTATLQGNSITVSVTAVPGDTPGDGAITVRPSGTVHIF